MSYNTVAALLLFDTIKPTVLLIFIFLFTQRTQERWRTQTVIPIFFFEKILGAWLTVNYINRTYRKIITIKYVECTGKDEEKEEIPINFIFIKCNLVLQQES